MSLSAFERETVITFSDGEETATVYTAQRPIITKLKRNPAARLIEEGKFEGSAWATFELDQSLVSFRRPRAKLALSEEERQERAERLRAVRAKASAGSKA